ncbi:MAG: ABC transporter substrate-binding protein [Proteobacteria bacterium]|nr:ABC transporter substrate-binding protein [Pseudomonadota bacterium]
MKRLLFLTSLVFISLQLEAATIIQDYQNQKFELTERNQRIASAFVGADEIILALLADEPQRLVALSPLARDIRYSSIANEAKRWQVFGEEFESLIKLKPDLVIAARYTRPEWIQLLKIAKIKTFVLGDFSSIEDIKRNIKTIGSLLQKERAADALIANFQLKIDSIKKNCKLQGKKVLSYSPSGQVMGKGTSFNDIFAFLGAENLAASIGINAWAILSQEKILTLPIDYIIAEGELSEKTLFLAKLRQASPWKHLKAIQEGHKFL